MSKSGELWLGIEGGGTRTTAVAADDSLAIVARGAFGPGNVRLLNDRELRQRLAEIAAFCPAPQGIGLGLAGTRDEADRTRVRDAVRNVWGNVPSVITHDLEIALAAANQTPEAAAHVLVLSGTGSCCYGRNTRGREVKLGGWGHLLGDKGSGYDIGLKAARAAIYEYDRHDRWTGLGESILRGLLLNRPEDLIGWIGNAQKAEIAALAVAVFDAASGGDKLARKILGDAAGSLAHDAVLCARKLAPRGRKFQFVFAGSVLVKQPTFAREVTRRIKRELPGATASLLANEGAWGAARLAKAAVEIESTRNSRNVKKINKPAAIFVPEFVPGTSPTEQRNPRSMNFDRLPIKEAIQLMLEEEQTVAEALLREAKSIERAVRLASNALQSGGRIFYAGAGTSGRLGILDASECPPTFRAPPELVQGIMAGGQRALWQAVEGAEDDAPAGAESVKFRGVRRGDVLVGIAASGRTPFVWGALAAARAAGAKTVLLHFNPSLVIPAAERPDVIIAANLGPEVLTGSTRLKCGTATKLVLNMISTISMVRLGKVVSNLMVDLNPSNVKLRDRAIRIVMEITRCPPETARAALDRHGWVIKKALASLRP